MSRFYNLEQAPFNNRELSNRIVAAIAGQYNGAYFDAQDMSTMFQDAAGTTPVTAMEQSVGKWLDKSGNGNHATQSVTASRPVVSARYNVLLGTDSPVTQSITASGVPATLSFYGTGSVQLSGAYSGVLNGTGVNNRVSLSFTPSASSLTLTISGSVTNIMLHRGIYLLPYQRVNTATDYDTVGFKKYLKFDGVDDHFNLPYIGLYANGSASIICGILGMQKGLTFNGRLISEGNSTLTTSGYTPIVQLYNHVTSQLYLAFDEGGGAGASLAIPQNEICVGGIIDTGRSVISAKNGGVTQTITYTRSKPITLNRTAIGHGVNNGANEYWRGNLFSLVIAKSSLSNSERRRVERVTADNCGVQL